MSITLRRITYYTQQQSLKSLSRSANIPYSTLWRVSKGRANLPQKYDQSLRNAYQREAYSRLRTSGMSASQARRFSWRIPESVATTNVEMDLLVDDLSLGATQAKATSLDRKGLSYKYDELYKEMRESVVEGLNKSRLTYEDWQDYL